VRITLDGPGPDGLTLVSFGQPGQPGGWFTWTATAHELDDLEALLAGRDLAAACDGTDGDHTCWLPPDHTAVSHQCRACPHQWPAPDQLPLTWDRPDARPAADIAAVGDQPSGLS
jgi:hypothetical protein